MTRALSKLSFIYMAGLILSLLVVSLSSCSDELNENEYVTPVIGEYEYISLNILLADDAPSTRDVFDSPSENTSSGAFIFNEGLDQEKAVAINPDAHWVLAFDNSQNITACLPLQNLQEISVAGSGATAYKGVCKIPVNDPFLSSINNMRVIMNASSELQQVLKSGVTSLNEIPTDKLFFIDNDGTAYYTMTTAMTIRNNRLMPSSETVMENGRLKTYEKLTEALDNPSVTLYVERMQAKFTILFHHNGSDRYFNKGEVWEYNSWGSSKNEKHSLFFIPESNSTLSVVSVTGDGQTIASNKNWKINITGWGINATEKTEFLFKYLGQSPTNYNNWNYPSNGTAIRNLWSVDPNYTETYSSSYPDQYRNANDKILATNGDSFRAYIEEEETHTLDYYSFLGLSKREIREYSGENTYSATQTFSGLADPLGDLVHLRCGSHLIICAQLLIEGMDDNDVYNSGTVDQNGLILSNGKRVAHKYFTNNQFWTKKDYIDYFRKELGKNLNTTTPCISDFDDKFVPKTEFNPIEENPIFYVNNNGVFKEASDEDFDIVPAEIVGGDGWCFPFPKENDGHNTALYVKTGSGNNSRDFTIVTIDKYKKLAYGYTILFAKHYNEGMMYYAFPIMHDPGRSDEGNFGKRTGDLGVVRNNWYNFKVGGLIAPGTSVDNPEQPIIPNNEPSSKGLGFEVMIIPWHLVYEEVNI